MKSINLKLLVKPLIDRLPNNGTIIKTMYRKAILIKRIVKVKMSLNKEFLPDPEKVLWIDPDQIVFYTNYCKTKQTEKFKMQESIRIKDQDFKNQVFDRNKDKGKIYGGNWDTSNYRFSELEIYKALEQRINHGIAWHDTKFYKNTLMKIEKEIVLWNCKNKAAFDKRCRYLDRLIQSIKENGYKLNSEVCIDGDKEHSLAKHSILSAEITVNIGRNGNYLFQDGRHRLAIAKILKLKKIPVKVLVRHEEWFQLRKFLISMAKGTGGASKKGVLYQTAIHLDLQDIAAQHECNDRFFSIKKHVKKNTGNVLDIGANLGYFCHEFEKLGFNCYAIELLNDVAWAANKIRIAEGRSFNVITGDLFESFNNSFLKKLNYEVVIALNIFHHFIKTKEKHNALKRWLKTLSVEMMFFEPHKSDEPQMVGSYINYNEDEFVSFILQNSMLNKAEFIYLANDNRKIYKLSR